MGVDCSTLISPTINIIINLLSTVTSVHFFEQQLAELVYSKTLKTMNARVVFEMITVLRPIRHVTEPQATNHKPNNQIPLTLRRVTKTI